MPRTALAVVVWLVVFSSIGYAMLLEPKCLYERDDIENPPYRTIHFEESVWGVREWLRRDCWVELHGCRGRTDSIKIGMEFRHLDGNLMGNPSPPPIEGHVAIYDGSTFAGEGWVRPRYAWSGNDIALSVEIPVNPHLAARIAGCSDDVTLDYNFWFDGKPVITPVPALSIGFSLLGAFILYRVTRYGNIGTERKQTLDSIAW